MRVTISILSILFMFCLSACGKSTPSNYYLLESGISPIQVDNLPKTTLRIAQAEAPSYLNRNNIVSRVNGESKLILAEFHLWAEPVANGVRRVVSQILMEPLMNNGINVLAVDDRTASDYVLMLEIQRFDGNFEEDAVLECRWTLWDREDHPIRRGFYSAREKVNGADYNLLVKAESKLARDMGSHLAKILPPLLKKKG